MKRVLGLLISVWLIGSGNIKAQDAPPVPDQQWEDLAAGHESETEDDAYQLQWEQWQRHPFSVNNITADELRSLQLLTEIQVEQFIAYRKLCGKLIDLHELQAVPGWSLAIIHRLLSVLTMQEELDLPGELSRRWRKGTQRLLLRFSQVVETSAGFSNRDGTKYLGSRPHLFLRYRYAYKDLLQFGITADKDAGEPFFRKSQRYGFDFYSFHIYATKLGKIKALVAGDFVVNLGQGLIQWQSLAFGKGASVMSLKRESSTLQPYHSAGEFNFYRGLGVTWSAGKFDVTAFVSRRNLSAHIERDSVGAPVYFSSFQTSGYHRTESEIRDRNSVTQTTAGINITTRWNGWTLGVNGVAHHFSLPLQKDDKPYNLYSVRGDHWSNASVNYSRTLHNLHFFGEMAADEKFSVTCINGLLMSITDRMDVSVLHRFIASSYQAVDADAFLESTQVSNESGLYMGINMRVNPVLQLSAYADVDHFPWLKYGVDGPSYGKDFLVNLAYTPDKKIALNARFRQEIKMMNAADDTSVTDPLQRGPRTQFRLQINYQVTPQLSWQQRVDWLRCVINDKAEYGFLIYADVGLKQKYLPVSIHARWQYFETASYNSRLYAYEDDVLYANSTPVFFKRGYRYYTLLNYNIRKYISIWLRWSQTIYPLETLTGTGLDKIDRNHKSQIELQMIYQFS